MKPSKIGGHRKKTLRGEHAAWLIGRCRDQEFHRSQLVAELLEVRGLKVDRHTVWDFVHAEGLSFKKNSVRQRAGSPRRRQAG